MKKLLATSILALGIAAATPALAQPVPTVTFSNGSTAPFTLAGNAYIATGSTYAACCGTSPTYADPFLAFGGGDGASGVLTTTFNTVSGSSYLVSFDFGALGGGLDPLLFTVGGTTTTFSAQANDDLFAAFQRGSFSFTGTGSPVTLAITSSGAPGADAIIDNLAVTGAVPEPATWAMMMLGFGMVGFGLRRRSKQAVRVTYA